MEFIQGCHGKQSWPELVGMRGTRAAAIIEAQNENVRAIILPEGSPVTYDLRCDRVWVFIDRHGVVVEIPKVT